MKASLFLNDMMMLHFSWFKVETPHIALFSPILLNLTEKPKQSERLFYLCFFLTFGENNILKSIVYHSIKKPRPSRRESDMNITTL